MENTENILENSIEVKLDNKQRAYATGKRKNSIARVWIKRGSGSITINGKALDMYFARPVLQMIVNQPLNVIDGEGGYEIMATVKGGGLSGQAGAIRHGI
ncbi:MAG: 30S ribosomal protein S9, partial [Pelagibacteraceae bacterium]|nr:30S ribosomal protein S9 [Pelagibacteraceae bacterium]